MAPHLVGSKCRPLPWFNLSLLHHHQTCHFFLRCLKTSEELGVQLKTLEPTLVGTKLLYPRHPNCTDWPAGSQGHAKAVVWVLFWAVTLIYRMKKRKDREFLRLAEFRGGLSISRELHKKNLRFWAAPLNQLSVSKHNQDRRSQEPLEEIMPVFAGSPPQRMS